MSYAELLSGSIAVRGRRIACAPSHSPRLAAAAAESLVAALRSGAFPLRLPLVPLSARPSLLPIEA